MTYTLVVRPEPDLILVATATNTPNTGPQVHYANKDMKVFVQQSYLAFSEVPFGKLAIELMADGIPASRIADVLSTMQDHRWVAGQMIAMDAKGSSVYTGPGCIPAAEHVEEDGIVSAANLAKHAGITAAIIDAWKARSDLLPKDRLFHALYAGEKIGDLRGRAHSAAIMVVRRGEEPITARVNFADNALDELRNVKTGKYQKLSQIDNKNERSKIFDIIFQAEMLIDQGKPDQLDRAWKILETIANDEKHAYRGAALFNQARIAILRGDESEAQRCHLRMMDVEPMWEIFARRWGVDVIRNMSEFRRARESPVSADNRFDNQPTRSTYFQSAQFWLPPSELRKAVAELEALRRSHRWFVIKKEIAINDRKKWSTEDEGILRVLTSVVNNAQRVVEKEQDLRINELLQNKELCTALRFRVPAKLATIKKDGPLYDALGELLIKGELRGYRTPMEFAKYVELNPDPFALKVPLPFISRGLSRAASEEAGCEAQLGIG